MTQTLAALAFDVPVRTVSLTNQRGHWGKRARRAKDERLATWGAWHATPHHYRGALLGALAAGAQLQVLMRRVDPSRLDDDNIRGALKHVRDELARCLGLADDADPRVAWAYDQRHEAGCMRVDVEITEVITT